MDIVNRVAQSTLVTFDWNELYTPGERVEIDIKEILFEGLIIRERDVKNYLQAIDLSSYQDRYVAITCSVDAIIPPWVYMKMASALIPRARKVIVGTLSDLDKQLYRERLNAWPWDKYRGAKVIVKGCGKHDIPIEMWGDIMSRLQPIAQRIMYGEACSQVPIFKQKKDLLR